MEQQMKLSTADKSYVSDSDGFVIGGDGFPVGSRIPNLQISCARAEKTAQYHRASLWRQRKSISL